MLRRSFLASAAASACVGTWTVNAAELKSTENDTETDVLIIGFGGAGAVAAIEAHDCNCNANILIVEKSDTGGGNTCVSAGAFMIPAPENKEHVYEYLSKTYDFAKSEKDPELIRIFVDEIVKQKEFLKSLGEGVQLEYFMGPSFPTLPYADDITQWYVKYNGKHSGPALFDLYTHAVQERNIPVWFNSPAKRLILSDGKVVGAQVEKEGKLCNVKAKKGVILTCGGFENNQEMLRTYALGTDIGHLGTPYNTGDGLNMAAEAGAQFWHMTAYSGPFGTYIPEKKAIQDMDCPAAGIWVDRNAKRFVDEKKLDFHNCIYEVDHLSPIELGYPRIPIYLIFDERARKSETIIGIITGWIGFKEGFKWSKQDTAEIEMGVIKQAETIPQLAEKVGLDPQTLQQTVETWNTDVANGKDTVEGRAMKAENGSVISRPINRPPYYAVPLYPALFNTQGGPRRNANCQIVNPYGEPIPGLYSAGELGSMWGNFYQGACNNAEALVFGRRAGRIVASL